MNQIMLFHLWNFRTDKVILTGNLAVIMTKAIALIDRGCLTFEQFEITNYGQHYLPWEEDFQPIIYTISK